MNCRCFEIGGPFIDVDPSCPEHGAKDVAAVLPTVAGKLPPLPDYDRDAQALKLWDLLNAWSDAGTSDENGDTSLAVCEHIGSMMQAYAQEAITQFLERSGQYLTNDASREAAIAQARQEERKRCAKWCDEFRAHIAKQNLEHSANSALLHMAAILRSGLTDGGNSK